MPRPLPEHVTYNALKQEVRDLLASQRAGDPAACERLDEQLRLAGRPTKVTAETEVCLTEAQFAVAADYGYRGWGDLSWQIRKETGEIDASAPAPTIGRESACRRAAALFEELQDGPTSLYQRSQMWSLMVTLHAMGREDADYNTLMAVSGWSGQFVYHPKHCAATFVEPGPTISTACHALGLVAEEHRVASAEEAWDLVRQFGSADRLVLGEHMEYGVFAGVEEEPEPRVRYFVQPFLPEGAWWTRAEFEKTWWDTPGDKRLFTVVSTCPLPRPHRVAGQTLAQLVRLATERYWDGWRRDMAPEALTGPDAMEQYARDIRDLDKAMCNGEGSNQDTCFFDRGWCCYAVYPQSTARECTAQYLDRAVSHFTGETANLVRRAADRYHRAFKQWRQWEKHLGRDEEFGPCDERWADAEHRAAGSLAVLAAADEERRGISMLRAVLGRLNDRRQSERPSST